MPLQYSPWRPSMPCQHVMETVPVIAAAVQEQRHQHVIKQTWHYRTKMMRIGLIFQYCRLAAGEGIYVVHAWVVLQYTGSPAYS